MDSKQLHAFFFVPAYLKVQQSIVSQQTLSVAYYLNVLDRSNRAFIALATILNTTQLQSFS